MDLDAGRNDCLIYDVGAHLGEDTEFYLKKGFAVVAIEANPALSSGLLSRFSREISEHRLSVLNLAISSSDGPVDFYVNEKLSIWGTTDPQWALRNRKMGAPSRKITVEAQRFEAILAKYGIPYYLKIDIEGADLLCVEALRGFGTRPRFISIESEKVKWPKLVDEFDLLEALGYRRFKLVNQSQITEQRPPHPAREGRYVEHKFSSGCTGLFGEEVPGEWLTREDALQQYEAVFLKYRYFGDNTIGARVVHRIPQLKKVLLPGWYDTHASLG